MTRNLPRIGRRRVAIVVVAAASLFVPSSASGHSTLERSEPPNGGKVAVGRSTLTLWFAEPISVAGSRFRLRTRGGGTVPVAVASSAAAGRQRVELGASPLAKGTYRLEWRAVSLADGHSSSGSVEFGVGVRPVVAAAANDDLPGVPGLVLRWLDLSAIMLAIGALAVSGRVLGSMVAGGDAAGRRARRIAALAAAIAAATGAVTPYLRASRGGSVEGWLGTTWTTMAGTRWGHIWLGREAALVIAAIALGAWAARRGAARGQVHVAVVALAAAVSLDAWAGHAASLPRQSDVAALASAAHLAAAGVWAGGAAALALCVLPAIRRHPGSRGGTLVAVGQTFSPIAAIATVVLLATGLYASGRHLPDLGSVGTTVYGNAVAAKVGLLGLALMLAACNTLIVNPRLAAALGPRLGRSSGWTPVAPRHFPALLAAEVAVIVVSVLAAAVLTSAPTAREVAAAATQTAPSAANVDGLFVTFEAVPAGAGQSRLIVRTREIVKPPPAPIAGVDVRVSGATEARPGLALAEVEPGRYEADARALAPGPWQASVAVHRDGLPDAVLRAGWSVPAAAGADVTRLESTTTVVAVLLLAAVAAAASLTRLRRHRRTSWIPSVDKHSGRRQS